MLRILADGTIAYANDASAPLLEAWRRAVGERLASAWRRRVARALSHERAYEAETSAGGRVFALTLAPVPEYGYVNIYGRDVTARREAQHAQRHHADRLWLLRQASQVILTAHSEREMARVVLRQVPCVIACVRVCAVTFDLEAHEMSLLGVYAGGELRPEQEWHGPLGDMWLEVVEVLAQGETYVVPDVQVLCPASPRLEQLRAEGVRAYVCAPLLVEDQLIGSLNLGLPAAGPIDQEQLSFIHELADELAIGLRQMHLYRAVQHHAEALEQEVASRTAQLAASEARFRAVFEEAALGIALLDEEGHIVASNPALEAMLGYSADALHCTALAAFVDPAHPPADGSLFRELVDGSRASYAEQRRYLCQDGGVIDANVTLSLVAGAHEAGRFAIALVDDVTERRQAQRALIESEKLALIGELAASVAHEVNNPLQSVIGCLDLARETAAEGGSVDRYIEIALEELERAVGVMRRMQDLSRRSEQDWKEPAEIRDLLEQVLLLAKKRYQDAGVETEVHLADDLPSLPVVPDQIQQVFLHLILNAVDAMPQGGQLRITARRTDAPPGVEIAFSDMGSGIPVSFLPRLFQPFATTKARRLGLGLYVCRTIVEQHHGRIEVNGDPSKGTTFAIWLPTGSPG